MKKSLLLLPLLITAAAGGHYALWHQQSSKFAEAIDRNIQKLGKGEYENLTLAYEKKNISGYPTKTVISLVNPVFTNKEADFSARIDGALQLAAPLLGDKLDMTIDGALQTTMAEQSYSMTSDMPTHCSLTAAGSIIDYMIGNNHLPKAPTAEDFAKNFRHFSCDASGVTFKDTDKKVIGTADMYHISLNSSPSGEKEHMFNFALQVKNAEILESDSYVAALGSDPTFDFIQDISWIDYKDLGKQNITITGGFVGAIDSDENFQFDLQEATFDNALYRMNFPISVHNKEKLAITHEGVLQVQEKFDALNKQGATNLITKIKEGELPEDVSITLTKKIKAGDVQEDVLLNAVPQLHPYGEIKTFLNVHGNLLQQQGVIEKIGFSTDLFSLIAMGEMSEKNLAITVECGKCDVLTDRLTDYANAVTALLHAAEEVSSPVLFTPQAVQAITSITHDLDSNKEDENITWVIGKTEQGQYTISSQPAEAVFMRVMMEVVPHMPLLAQE